MNNFRSDVTEALKTIGCESESFSPVNIVRWRNIEKKIASSFLRNGVRDSKYRWWWEHLKEPVISFVPFYPPDMLLRLVPSDEQVYFILEDGNKFWLYEGYINAFYKLVSEMYHFEYYVVSKKMEWLLCENHHSCLIASGNYMVKKINEHGLA